jgi:arsenate reductase (glutaredoxin)
MKVYGIKACGSVKKATTFLDSHNISYEFIDLKKVQLTLEDINSWLQYIPLEKLLNRQGTTYKKFGLKDMNLDEDSIKEWLLKEQMLIKRPVLVMTDKVLVGFDENAYLLIPSA